LIVLGKYKEAYVCWFGQRVLGLGALGAKMTYKMRHGVPLAAGVWLMLGRHKEAYVHAGVWQMPCLLVWAEGCLGWAH
jgi:hypothetical protein